MVLKLYETDPWSRIENILLFPKSDEWSSFWHPLYGMCFSFKPVKNVSEIVGSAGVEYVKVNLNFSAAFPVPAHPEGVNPFPEGDLITINIGADENENNSEPITIEKRSPVDFEVAFFSSFRPKRL